MTVRITLMKQIAVSIHFFDLLKGLHADFQALDQVNKTVHLNLIITAATKAPGDRCAPEQFECLSDRTCIPSSYQCDEEPDCPDRSDEYGCSKCTTALNSYTLFFLYCEQSLSTLKGAIQIKCIFIINILLFSPSSKSFSSLRFLDFLSVFLVSPL